jgi:SAM-dependent methyltransferase
MKEHLHREIINIEKNHWWFVARRKIIKSFLKKSLNKKTNNILDIGSGTGTNFSVLKVFSDNLTGLEPFNEAINYSQNNFPEIPIIRGSFPEFDIINKFDLISLFDVLEHLEEEKLALDKIYKALNPGGYVVITVPAYMFMWTKHDEIAHHKRRYTKRNLSETLRASGFKIDRMSYFNTLLFVPIVVVRFFSKFFIKDGENSDFSKTPDILNGLLKFIFGLESYALPYIIFPFGVSIICLASKND